MRKTISLSFIAVLLVSLVSAPINALTFVEWSDQIAATEDVYNSELGFIAHQTDGETGHYVIDSPLNPRYYNITTHVESEKESHFVSFKVNGHFGEAGQYYSNQWGNPLFEGQSIIIDGLKVTPVKIGYIDINQQFTDVEYDAANNRHNPEEVFFRYTDRNVAPASGPVTHLEVSDVKLGYQYQGEVSDENRVMVQRIEAKVQPAAYSPVHPLSIQGKNFEVYVDDIKYDYAEGGQQSSGTFTWSCGVNACFVSVWGWENWVGKSAGRLTVVQKDVSEKVNVDLSSLDWLVSKPVVVDETTHFNADLSKSCTSGGNGVIPSCHVGPLHVNDKISMDSFNEGDGLIVRVVSVSLSGIELELYSIGTDELVYPIMFKNGQPFKIGKDTMLMAFNKGDGTYLGYWCVECNDGNPPPVTPPVPDVVPSTSGTCAYNGNNLPVGIRADGKYCDIDGTMKDQMDGGQPADNNFECRSNLALDGQCLEQGLLNKILAWFSRLFNLN